MQVNMKELYSQLKNNEIHRLYYFFGENINGVETVTNAVIKKTVGDYKDFALTKINGKSLNVPELADKIEMMPMLSEYNCILINDYNADEQREDKTKELLKILKDIPDHTVIIFNVTGFDIKNGKKTISPKNKKLTDFSTKNGILCECAIPSKTELRKYIISKVNKNGCSISERCADEISEYCLNDVMTIENEIKKLCSYAQDSEITSDIINLLVSRQTDIDVYKLANAVCQFDGNSAFQALDELLAQRTERGKIIFALSNSFIDIYRAGVAKKYGKQINQVTQDFKYTRDFVVRNAFRNSSGISVSRLRKCVSILCDTALKLNSTCGNERIIMEKAISEMLVIPN